MNQVLWSPTGAGGSKCVNLVRPARQPGSDLKSVRPEADHSRMETTLQVLAWVGVVAAAAVTGALVVGVLFSI
jgi:hypothetical protein